MDVALLLSLCFVAFVGFITGTTLAALMLVDIRRSRLRLRTRRRF